MTNTKPQAPSSTLRRNSLHQTPNINPCPVAHFGAWCLGLIEETPGWTVEPSDGRAVLPLPRRGGEGRGEGETGASRHVVADPLTLTLSPSEGERETIACACRPSDGILRIGSSEHEIWIFEP